MSESKIIELNNHPQNADSASAADPLTEILQTGARRLLREAIEAEVSSFLAEYADLKDEQGRRRLVRNGYLPKREIQTGIGSVKVKVPRVRDRAKAEEKIRFQSLIVPPYLRRTKSIETLLPWLYLKGISTGDFSEALQALLGANAPGLSATTISRLKAQWTDSFETWSKRDLSQKRYVYFWVDGVYFNIRSDSDKSCILVIIGATEDGTKELIAVEEGFRENELSWRDILLDLKRRGLPAAPKLAVGDGALGFWTALSKIFPETRMQRCWVHAGPVPGPTANVLNALPKSQQVKAKSRLHQIYLAETKQEAEKAFDHFIELYQVKYPKAAHCLEKDRESLLAFYDFPAEHWIHLRTTNPIESTCATVRLRTAKTRGCVSRTTILMLVCRLCQCAEQNWRCLNGSQHLVKVFKGIKFVNGIEEIGIAA